MELNKVSPDLKENEAHIKEVLGESTDIFYRHFSIPGFRNMKAFLVYLDGMASGEKIENTILQPLMSDNALINEKKSPSRYNPVETLMQSIVYTELGRKCDNWEEILDSLLGGETILFLEKSDTALIFATWGWETRGVQEPETETEVRGPRDGFTENMITNIVLMRRRVRDYNLRFEGMRIGERTKTSVTLAYIETLVDHQVLKELKTRLDRIKVDGILESGYLEEFIEDTPTSIFPQIQHTERPDKACAALLEGKIAIITDNTTAVLIVPTVFWQFIQATGDYYDRAFIGTFQRWTRIVAIILSLTLSSLYVLATAFHQEMLPTSLALKLAAGREGVPFPSVVEALIMEFMFDIMREAGVRMPKAIGQAVSIVGALVMGDAAVNAGLVGPGVVLVIAAAGISSFAIPYYSISVSLRLLRYPLLVLSATFGLLGFLAGIICIALHMLSLRSFGMPYLAPINPWRVRGNKDIIIRAPWWSMTKRPRPMEDRENDRQKEETLRPQPPTQSRPWRKGKKKR